MVNKIKAFFNFIDMINDMIGSVISLLLSLIMLAIGAATISRYFFGNPITIVWPIIKQIFGVLVLLGAPYAMLHDKHIRVEIFYDFFPAWLRKVSRMISLIFFLALTGALTWQGTVMAKMSLMLKEVSQQSAHIPIYPFKIFLPIAGLLFLFQGIAYFLREEESIDD